MIKAFLFDMDGVLLDSEATSAQVAIAYFRTLGYTLKPEDFVPYQGMGERTYFSGPAKDYGIEFVYEEASAFFKEHYPAVLQEMGACLLPGAQEIFRRAKKAGLMTAVASSAPLWKVKTSVESLALEPGLLDLYVSGNDITRNKPFGDIYRFCLDKFGIEGKEAIVFEDALGGIKAGLDAGCHVVGIATSLSKTVLQEAGTVGVLENVAAFPSFEAPFEINEIF